MRKGVGLPARLTRTMLLGAVSLLAACGGGGGGGGGMISTPAPVPSPSPTPAPVPTPTPTPTSGPVPTPSPSPVPASFDTAEFRRSDGPLEHNAATAWSLGKAGTGVTVAVIDTGIDTDNREFAGRISPASRDLLSSTSARGYEATDDHGTHVALIAAAARDGTGIVGMAWGATVLALRADDVGSCQSDNPARTGVNDCEFNDVTIAHAIDYAVTSGARVVNLSLDGESPLQELRDAVARAVQAGLVVIVSAGNDGFNQPDTFAAGLANASATGGVIIVGSMDDKAVISAFSNRAGVHQDHFLVARGEDVCCQYKDGTLFIDKEGFQFLFSGTSFAAPQVAGAAAILAQAFPALTGREIADIILKSAADLGSPGIDPIYGRGMLDVARALQPIGTTSLPGSTAPLALGDGAAVLSQAMGDAAGKASLQTVVLDEYRRAYGVELGGTVKGAQPDAPLFAAVGSQQRHVVAGIAATSVALTIDARGKAGELPRVGYLRLPQEQAEGARVLAARIALTLSPDMNFAFAYAEGADGLVAQVQGRERPAFMVARDTPGDAGMARSSEAAMALRHQFGPWGLTLSAESGSAWSGAVMERAAEMRGRRESTPVGGVGLALDRRFGTLRTALGLTWMREDETLLGARFHDAFGLAGADTLFLDADAGWGFAPGWRLGGAFRQGWTGARGGGLVAPGTRLSSRAWSLDLARAGLFAAGDTLGLRLSQPLRVESGAINLSLPVDYNYATLAPTYGIRSIDLAPQGRELTGELAWRGPLWTGDAALSLFWRKDPGHYASLPDDRGVALRWGRKF